MEIAGLGNWVQGCAHIFLEAVSHVKKGKLSYTFIKTQGRRFDFNTHLKWWSGVSPPEMSEHQILSGEYFCTN